MSLLILNGSQLGDIRNRIDSDALMDVVRGKGFGEAGDSTFGRSIVDHAARTSKGYDRGGIDDTVKNVSTMQHKKYK